MSSMSAATVCRRRCLSVSLSRLLSAEPASSVLWTTDAGATEPRIASPLEVMNELYRRFPYDMQTGQYFTMVYAVVDLENRKMSYASAGHEPMIIIGPNREPEYGSSTGQPVALVPAMIMKSTYEERTVDIAPGDRVYLYSDGIPESRDAEGEQYGNERLAAKLVELLGSGLDGGLPVVLETVRQPGRAAPISTTMSPSSASRSKQNRTARTQGSQG